MSSDFHCIANHLEVTNHDYQVLLLCMFWENLYLKIIFGLLNIMTTDDVLEIVNPMKQFHDAHISIIM